MAARRRRRCSLPRRRGGHGLGRVVSPSRRAGATTAASAPSRCVELPGAQARCRRSQHSEPTCACRARPADTRPQRLASVSRRGRNALEGGVARTACAERGAGRGARALPVRRRSGCLAGRAGRAATRCHRAPGSADGDAYLIFGNETAWMHSCRRERAPASAARMAARNIAYAHGSPETECRDASEDASCSGHRPIRFLPRDSGVRGLRGGRRLAPVFNGWWQKNPARRHGQSLSFSALFVPYSDELRPQA